LTCERRSIAIYVERLRYSYMAYDEIPPSYTSRIIRFLPLSAKMMVSPLFWQKVTDAPIQSMSSTRHQTGNKRSRALLIQVLKFVFNFLRFLE
jgi:hypothetical protein